jgi:hypothetical protein
MYAYSGAKSTIVSQPYRALVFGAGQGQFFFIKRAKLDRPCNARAWTREFESSNQ